MDDNLCVVIRCRPLNGLTVQSHQDTLLDGLVRGIVEDISRELQYPALLCDELSAFCADDRTLMRRVG